jgi:hypothetical protein
VPKERRISGRRSLYGSARPLNKTLATAAPFTAQVTRAIAAAKQAGLRILGIRADGTVIVHDGGGPIAEALSAVIGVSEIVQKENTWDDSTSRQRQPPAAADVAPVEVEKWSDPEWRAQRIEKWKAHVRKSAPGKLERRGLAGLYERKGKVPGHIKGASIGTMNKLEVRGFAVPVGEVKPGFFPFYEITDAGEAHWLKHLDEESH